MDRWIGEWLGGRIRVSVQMQMLSLRITLELIDNVASRLRG